MSAVGGACCGAAPRAEEAEPPASAHAAGGAATAAQAGGRAQAQGGAGAVAASAGPLEALEAGGVMAHWTGSLDKSVFELRVENPHARDRAASFAALSSASLFSQIPVADKKRLIADVIAQCPRHPVAKAMGSLVALAAGDATGHWFEFMDACDKPAVNRGATVFDVSKLEFVPATHDPERSHGGCFSGDIFNKFQLQMGQWTDDCSMGLAMADSLLVKRRYDGSDIRIRFWNWWNKGYCNAFYKDTSFGLRTSVGLGGNISKSIYSMKEGQTPTPRFESSGEDSGNGSLMRLAPIAIFHSSPGQLQDCMDYARESSYTTHPGQIAAECCSLQAFLIAKAIHDPALPIDAGAAAATAGAAEAVTARGWLEAQVEEYQRTVLADRSGVGVDVVKKLLEAREPEGSLERNWNWRASAEEGLHIEATLRARGYSYNGHPVSAGYFGSYAVDGLAIALHCVASTTSLDAALERCINFLGDADTTGAICGQLAGAIYGIAALKPAFVENLQQWDDGDVAVRAYMLYFAGEAQHQHPQAQAEAQAQQEAQQDGGVAQPAAAAAAGAAGGGGEAEVSFLQQSILARRGGSDSEEEEESD